MALGLAAARPPGAAPRLRRPPPARCRCCSLAAVIHLAGVSRLAPAACGGAGRLRRRRGWRVALGAAALLPFCAPAALSRPRRSTPRSTTSPSRAGSWSPAGCPSCADLRFPVFPQANEMLFALVMLFAPDVAAHGVQWLMTMLTAALVWAWARDAFSATSRGGRLAGGGDLPRQPDRGLSRRQRLPRGRAHPVHHRRALRRAALAGLGRTAVAGARRGLFAATAADTKYLGLFLLGVIGLTVLFGRLPDRTGAGPLARASCCSAPSPPRCWRPGTGGSTPGPAIRSSRSSRRPSVAGPWAPVRFQSFLAPPAGAGRRLPIGREGVLGARLVDLVRLP